MCARTAATTRAERSKKSRRSKKPSKRIERQPFHRYFFRNHRVEASMITIAVDAMGGDNAPRPEVEGSVLAAREFGVRIVLVGQPNAVRAALAKHAAPNLPIEIVPASEVITMNDHPAQAFRRKKDSSVHVAARLVREAKADGLVSA